MVNIYYINIKSIIQIYTKNNYLTVYYYTSKWDLSMYTLPYIKCPGAFEVIEFWSPMNQGKALLLGLYWLPPLIF